MDVIIAALLAALVYGGPKNEDAMPGSDEGDPAGGVRAGDQPDCGG